MKNRKRIIVAFLCVAMLAVGIGYAATTNLSITGSAKYYGQKQLQDSAVTSLKFSDANVISGQDYGTAAIAPATGGLLHTATLDVAFADTENTSAPMTTAALYEITYGESTQVLPELTLDTPTHALSVSTGGVVPTEFAMNAVFADSNGNPSGALTVDLEAGEKAYILVTVTFTKDGAVDYTDAQYTCNINVGIPYTTEAH